MLKTVVVNDKMQSGYSYSLNQPIGKNFHPEFKPQLSPKQMLALGVFEGKYMRDCTSEFPASWFTNAKFALGNKPDVSKNFFEIKASQSLNEWQSKNWIKPDDPRGWFQWYCRYYMGRRIGGYDEWQIKRWKAITRHIGQIKKHCHPKDITCRRRQRQALLHWAYDSRKI